MFEEPLEYVGSSRYQQKEVIEKEIIIVKPTDPVRLDEFFNMPLHFLSIYITLTLIIQSTIDN